MRPVWILAILVMAVGGGLAQTKPAQPKPSAPARQAPSKDEQALFDAANRERTEQRLTPLKWNAALASAARAHAQKMAQANRIDHQFPGEMDLGTRIRMAGVRFRAVAENVAQGPSAAEIHKLWMNSPPHRANLLDPDMDSIGIAAVERNGQLFAVQDFTQASP